MANTVLMAYAVASSSAHGREMTHRRSIPSAATVSPAIPNCRRASHSHIAARSITSLRSTPAIIVPRQSAFVTSNQNVAMRSPQSGGASMFVHTKRKLGA